jgi:hypothetical protein
MKCLGRLVVLVALAILALIMLVPALLQQAGNSLLSAFNNSAASGLAELIPANFNDPNNHLQVSVSGLTANGQYYVTLDPGSCGSSPYIDLGEVRADSAGNINKLFTLGSLDTSQTWYVDVHQGNDPSGTIEACGRLVTNSSSVAVNVTPILSLSPESTGSGQISAPTIGNASPVPNSTPQTGFPNTGVQPGSKNSYDNYVYPRKY